MGLADNSEHSDHLVRIRGLQFAYGRNRVLRGIDLDIPRGRVVAILGTSGSGKSTLLQLMAGSLAPAAGRVEVCGRDVHALTIEQLYALRRQMGMMFQKGGLFSDLSVFENVAFPIREHTQLPEELIRDLVLMKLNAVGLRGVQHLMPGELSGGMSRRVALARAIALDPPLILYDEPFAGLDPITLNVICNLIRVLNDALDGTSIVVTYDVHEAIRLADYLYILGDGAIVGHGPTQQMLESEDPFVRQFLHAQPDGPVPFHFPAQPIGAELGLVPRPAG
ncbi:MAG TPA: ABC transporter ATP-binding protein [Usitatibacter sp.]|nr:ABC transporter ATP-binding protein [Usitatibacter sp.]